MSQLTVVITGGSRGIGRGFVEHYLKEGHRVYVRTQHPKPIQELQSSYPQQLFLFQDLAPTAAVDVLINNAGVLINESDTFSALQYSDIETSMRVNVGLALETTQRLLPQLKQAAQPKAIFITSLMGSIGDNQSGGYYAYRISKAALNMMVKSLSIDEPKVISVPIHPGWVKTDMGGEMAPTTIQQSVRGMARVIAELKSKDSGKFFDFEGDVLPW